jgi:hypothetical protein
MLWRTAASPTRGLSAALSPKTATRRRWRSRVTTLPVRVRCWPKRATTPTLTACPRGLPVGGPPIGRHGTITPSAPTTKGAAASSAACASGAGRSPCPRACQGSWSASITCCPAACPHPHTACGLTVPPRYQPSKRAAVAHGTKTAKAQPRDWHAPLVRCCGCTPRVSSQGAPCGVAHPWGPRPTRRRHWIGPHRLVIWRFAQPVLRKPAPHCAQRGQSVGCGARSGNTASTRWTVSTRAPCHAAKLHAEREGASSTALSRRCTAGSLGRMLSCRPSIGHWSPLEPLAKASKSVPHFRCYASPPRTEISARFHPV